MPENIDDAMIFLQRNLRMRHEIKWVQRQEILEIPEDALREAVTNAVCHRNYFEEGANVMVEIYDDRVEIHNPGGLPKGLDMADFGTKSVTRNPIIADMLHRCGHVEKIGSGVKKIKDAIKAAGLNEPTFTSTYFFTVVFERPPLDMEKAIGAEPQQSKLPDILTVNEKRICDMVLADENITSAKMAELMGVNERTIKRAINSLTKKGLIVRMGSKKSGIWRLNTSEK